MKRLFLDTNVLVDLVCNREPFVDEAKRIFALAYANKVYVGINALIVRIYEKEFVSLRFLELYQH